MTMLIPQPTFFGFCCNVYRCVLDPNWYADTGATTHITTDPGNLASSMPYHGKDKINIGDGA